MVPAQLKGKFKCEKTFAKDSNLEGNVCAFELIETT
jgi:hypothetical protein